jgi:hypothetical protein
MNRSFALHFVLSGVLFLSAGRAFGSAGPHQHRIPQTIIVDGQQAEGVTVIQNGSAPKFYCPNPRPYTAADQSSSGWACFDANTGGWLLNAMPPASANGRQAEGVTVIQNGLAPTFDCPNPPPDAAADQSSNGGACFRANTGSIDTARPHGHAAPYAEYNYAYPDYTYYPEIFFDHPALSYGSSLGHGRHHR